MLLSNITKKCIGKLDRKIRFSLVIESSPENR